MFVISEKPSTFIPACEAAITSGTVDILQVRLSGDEVIAVGERQSKVLVGLVRAVVEAL